MNSKEWQNTLDCLDSALSFYEQFGYPEDKNPDLRETSLYVDWFRVYTREQSRPEEIEKPNWPEKEGFAYSSRTVEKRTFEPKMYWYPVPESEILRTGWEQNPKWN